MTYAHIYQKYTEEQKEKERQYARDWHKANYEKIKLRKQKQANDHYTNVGRAVYNESVTNERYKLGRLVQASKQRAKKQDLPHNLTLDYIVNLYEQQSKLCALTKREFYFGKSNGNKASANSPSIDKIDPTLGYVEGNVRLVVHHVNMAMSEFGLDALLKLVQDIKDSE
jgi:hypothetical protein